MSDGNDGFSAIRGKSARSAFITLMGAFLLSAAQPNAHAEEILSKPNFWSFGVTGGTQGIGGEASYLLYHNLVLRANASYIAFNSNETIRAYGGDNNEFDFDISGVFAGGMLDLHPFRSGWRLSAGLRYTDVNFKAESTDGLDLGVTNYTSEQIGTARTSVHNTNPAAPYIGFGYDTSHFSEDGAGFKLGVDIGALYVGKPDVSITTDKSVAGLADDIALEKAEIEERLDKYYNFYPVFMVSGRISF